MVGWLVHNLEDDVVGMAEGRYEFPVDESNVSSGLWGFRVATRGVFFGFELFDFRGEVGLGML
jgi:hypothetical protein